MGVKSTRCGGSSRATREPTVRFELTTCCLRNRRKPACAVVQRPAPSAGGLEKLVACDSVTPVLAPIPPLVPPPTSANGRHSCRYDNLCRCARGPRVQAMAKATSHDACAALRQPLYVYLLRMSLTCWTPSLRACWTSRLPATVSLVRPIADCYHVNSTRWPVRNDWRTASATTSSASARRPEHNGSSPERTHREKCSISRR